METTKILVGRTRDGVYGIKFFPKEGDLTVKGWLLSGKTVEDYVFNGGYAAVMAEMADLGEPEKINIVHFLPTFQADFKVYGAGGTYYNLDGKPQSETPKVLFRRSGKMLKPYGAESKLVEKTTKLTPEAELSAILNEDGKIVGYAYAADPTTKEGDKSGIKSSCFAVSFAVLTEDNKPLDLPLTYSLKGDGWSRTFDCIAHYTGGKAGLYLTEQQLVTYLMENPTKGINKPPFVMKGPALLMLGNPADAQLRVENDAEMGDKEAQDAFSEKIMKTLKTTLTQKVLLAKRSVFIMFFDI